MKTLFIKLFLMVILASFFLLLIAMVKTAKADEFGSYCIDKNGIERCTIWQWDSNAQRLIKKEIIRDSRHGLSR